MTVFVVDVSGAFEDDDIVHVEGDVDPVRDLEIINDELMLKDLEFINKQWDGLERAVARGGDKKKKPEYVRNSSFLRQLSNAWQQCLHISLLMSVLLFPARHVKDYMKMQCKLLSLIKRCRVCSTILTIRLLVF